MTSPIPPKKQGKNVADYPVDAYDDDVDNADIVAEEIEAGYDIQSDAAVRSLVDDPASSSDNDILPDA